MANRSKHPRATPDAQQVAADNANGDGKPPERQTEPAEKPDWHPIAKRDADSQRIADAQSAVTHAFNKAIELRQSIFLAFDGGRHPYRASSG